MYTADKIRMHPVVMEIWQPLIEEHETLSYYNGIKKQLTKSCMVI